MKVKIDTRPLPVVIASRWWRFPVYLLLGYGLYHFYQSPPPEGLSLEGFRALVVFLACLVLWVFHLLPLPITGLFSLIAPVLMGVMPAKQAFSFFGSEPVFFILGVFILAAALLKSGLSTRIALLLLRSAGHSPKRLLLQIMAASALLSFVMSEHAVAAMMFPLILVITRTLQFIPYGGSYGRLLFLAMAWGCIIGGIATMLGGGRVPLAVGMLQEAGQETITFLQWTSAVLPVVLITFLAGYLVLTRFYTIDVDSVANADDLITTKLRECGRPLLEEKFLALLVVGAIVGWTLWGNRFGMATISILVVVLLFMFRVVEWKDLEENVDWGIILMYGGAIGLSTILNSTGAGLWLVKTQVLPHLGSPWLLVSLLSLVSLLLTEALSNSAVVAILVPLGLSIAPTVGIDPKIIVYTVASAAGLGYALPISTPAMALAFSGGYFRIKDIVLPALLMDLISWLALMATARLWWPLLGIRI
ncbi:MAG: DASS family sodium-coupled anion symporter [Deltaproteobacteria bacterium]|nr:DASS family sodium-coupled anion symporter [Deltaproteobacteria bacterium]